MCNIIPGILVDLEELKKTSKIVLWGKLIHKDFSTTSHVKLLEMNVDWNILTEETIITDTIITDTIITDTIITDTIITDTYISFE